jgi:hypothetical protein
LGTVVPLCFYYSTLNIKLCPTQHEGLINVEESAMVVVAVGAIGYSMASY